MEFQSPDTSSSQEFMLNCIAGTIAQTVSRMGKGDRVVISKIQGEKPGKTAHCRRGDPLSRCCDEDAADIEELEGLRHKLKGKSADQ